GEAIGQEYVKETFSPEAKARAQAIVGNMVSVLHDQIGTLDWMSDATKTQATEKLDAFTRKIGYPDKWKDYSALKIEPGAYLANLRHAADWRRADNWSRVGKPVDRTEWGMTPPTVNAYYNAQMNEIVFPAGILQPPFFDPNAPMAVNYGAIGAVMGHEMTHGFDDQGSKFDGNGNFKNWWSEVDRLRFDKNVHCIAKQFSNYTVDGNVHLQGKLVTGEAIADLGGLKLAWIAFHASPYYKTAKTIDGFTPDQQFFLGFAHVWASNTRPEELRRRVTVDPHPPANYRVNGTLANLPQFQQAFHIPVGSPMVNKKPCVIW
ncbi:MAG: M13-type metalloendopeptidase, partial [Gammaproteobacteria bacterium]